MAGERWVASTWLLVKGERREEKEPRSEAPSACEIAGRAGVFEGLLCGKREDCSVGGSSSSATSSMACVDLSGCESESVKPL